MITELFSVNTTVITVLGYPLSLIELVGTVFNLASVYLVAKNKIATWPVGIIGVVLFAILFFQIQLYADVFEQIYYFITGFWGWYMWHHQDQRQLGISRASKAELGVVGLIIFLTTMVLGLFTSHLHLWWPSVFSLPASYPYLDALTTCASFAATYLMMRRRVECWYVWIAVDVVGIGLYATKDVMFVSLLYVVYLGLAINGLWIWRAADAAPAAELKVDQEALA